MFLPSNTIVVPMGKIRVSKGNMMISRDFAFCSAVVITQGNDSTTFTHSLPVAETDELHYYDFLNSSSVHIGNVVDKNLRLLKIGDVPVERPEAYVNAGC